MLTWRDCLSLSELTEDEIAAIADHERCPTIIAAELGHYLTETPDGQRRLKAIIRDDIEEARRTGDVARVSLLQQVLKHFMETHGPEKNA